MTTLQTSAPVRVMIIEDESVPRESLARIVVDLGQVELVGTHATAAEALNAIPEARPDVLLLDVEMPGIDGFDLLDGLPAAERPEVIFITAHDRYAVSAFDVGAVDYVLKPFDQQRVQRAVLRAVRTVEGRKGAPAEPARNGRARPIARLLIQQTGRSAFFVPVEEVSHLEAEGNYVRVHFGGQDRLLRSSLIDLEHRLDPAVFRRVHRSFIVNLRDVREIVPRGVSDYSVVLRDDTTLPVGRVYRDDLLTDA